MNKEQSMRHSRKRRAYLVLALVLIFSTSACITTTGQSSGEMKRDFQESYLYTSVKRFYPEGVPDDPSQIYPELDGKYLIPIEDELTELIQFISTAHKSKQSIISNTFKPLTKSDVEPIVQVRNTGRPDALSSPNGEITVDVRVLQGIFRGALLSPNLGKSMVGFLLGRSAKKPYDPERETAEQRKEIQEIVGIVNEVDSLQGNYSVASDLWDLSTSKSVVAEPWAKMMSIKVQSDDLQLAYAGAILFLVAHEYGHIVLGHHAEEEKLRADYPPDAHGENSLYCKRRRQFELDADAYAFLLMSPLFGDAPRFLTGRFKGQEGYEKYAKIEDLSTGETLELNTDDLIDEQIGVAYKNFFQYGYKLSGLSGAATCSYPSLDERIKALESFKDKLVDKYGSNYARKIHGAKTGLPAAIGKYQAALSVAERMARIDPLNVKWQEDLSINHEKIGDVQREYDDLSASLASYRASLSIEETLARTDGGNVNWQWNMATIHSKIGNVQVKQKDYPAALVSYRTSYALFNSLAQADQVNTDLQNNLSVSHIKIGDVQVAQGDFPAALVSYGASLSIRERLAQVDPVNTKWQPDLSAIHEKIGEAQLAQGETQAAHDDLPAALASYQASRTIFKRLTQTDVNNTDWQRSLAVSHNKIGEMLLEQKKFPAALASYQASHTIFERIARSNPGNIESQRDLAVSHSSIGEIQIAQGDLPAALASYQASHTLFESIARDYPANVESQRELILSNMILNKVTGNKAYAVKALDIAVGMQQHGILPTSDVWMIKELRRAAEQ